jgi:hypothetical protein
MKKITLLLICTNTVFLLGAQTYSKFDLQKVINLPNIGDSIFKQQVDYVDPGPSGTNIYWDFQHVKHVNDFYTLFYSTLSPDSTSFIGVEHGTCYYYNVKGDSLLHTGYENSTTLMKFTRPELRLKFPFRYGESVNSDFVGEGEFCNRIPIKVSGRTTVTVDATGNLSTPLGLTFDDAMRVKTSREYIEAGKDSLTMRLESYAWYVKNNRYPIFETIKTVTVGKEEEIHKIASFFFPPAEQAALLADTSKWDEVNTMDEVLSIEQIFNNCQLIPNPVVSTLIIKYELLQKADISFQLCDNSGISRIYTPTLTKDIGAYTETIDMAGFITGIYPLYVRVNNLIKVLTVIKV